MKRDICATAGAVLVLTSLAATGARHASRHNALPSAPAVTCSIVMDGWCLANSPAAVSMVDLPYRRLWLVTSPIGMQHGPLVIVSDKTCSHRGGVDVSFAGESEIKVSANGRIKQAIFRLDNNGCELKFEWPAGAADPYSYQEFMVFNVLVRQPEGEQYVPLYPFYDKTRCHGVFVKKGSNCD